MDFSLSTEQVQLQDSLDRALATLSPLPRIRRHAEMPGAFAADIWQGLVELGVPGLLIAEAHGGLGQGILDAALVAETLGKHCVPAPYLGPAVLAPLAIEAAGSEAQQRELLPLIASGALRIGVGLSELTAGLRAGAGVACRDGRLHGCALFVIDDAGAACFLVADQGGGLHLVDRDAPGLAIATLDTLDRTRSTAKLVFDAAPGERLPGANGATTRRLADAARVMLAADMLGAAWKMLDQAVAYAKLREQFGRPIGSFQAVKHLCAEMAAELEPGRALIWYAGYALDQHLSDAPLCSVQSKAYIAEAARFVSRTATEVHGGIGITDELGLHYWFKRIAWSYQALGSPERLREEAAQLQSLA